MHESARTSSTLVLVAPLLGALFIASHARAAEEGRTKAAPSLAPILRALSVDVEEAVPLTAEQRHIAEGAGHRMVSLCPDCRLSTIEEDGPCGWARVNRQIIRAAAAKGMDEDSIVQTYVQTYGSRILARSKSRGFAAASWAIPIACSVAGLLLVFFIGARMRRREPLAPTTASRPATTSDDAQQLERELAEIDDR